MPKRKRSSCEPFSIVPQKYDPSDGGAEAVDQTDEGIDPGGWSPHVEHRWEVRTPAVAAVGTTPFGRFVSLGAIDGSTMTLARRYIADDDPRAAWASPAAVLDACLDDAQLEEEEELALADIPAKLPWKVDS